MIVLGESNFVLELAFRQEESEDAERILAMAEAGDIRLAIPACALFEPYETLVRRRNERHDILDRVRREIAHLSRSREFPDFLHTSRGVTETLARSSSIEARGLSDTLRRLMAHAEIHPLTGEIMERALQVQDEFSFAPQDAVVFASVEHYLRRAPDDSRLFINRNHTDFLQPDIVAHFANALRCRLIPSFSNARRYLDAERDRTGG